LRGGYGSERYEEAELQSKVRKIFQTIGEDVGKEKWKVVDAGRTEEEVGVEIRELVRGVIEKEKGEVDLLWVD
jgi:dTMP kinase